MYKKVFNRVVLTGIAFSICSAAFATNNYPTVAPYPDTIYVRKSCGTMANCGTTIDEARTWMGYKQPSATSPVLVDIGPGTFSGYFICGGSRISIKGAGPTQTVLTGKPTAGFAIRGSNCFDLNVQDLSIKAETLTAVSWEGTGSSTWTNVQVENSGIYAWTETACPSDPAAAPVHKWFASTLMAIAKTYEAQCSDNWFFGSRLILSSYGASSSSVINALSDPGKTYGAKFHVYGSNITLQLPAGVSAPPIASDSTGVMAVHAAAGSEVHIHGTGIDVIGNGSVNAIAALVSTGGTIHANQAAYNLDGKGGPVARIVNFGGHIHAPYFWEAHDAPPAITSVTGADTAVVNNNSDGHPHLVIYDTACTSKWFDIVTKLCR